MSVRRIRLSERTKIGINSMINETNFHRKMPYTLINQFNGY